jgi:hypothetical protein
MHAHLTVLQNACLLARDHIVASIKPHILNPEIECFKLEFKTELNRQV